VEARYHHQTGQQLQSFCHPSPLMVVLASTWHTGSLGWSQCEWPCTERCIYHV
jgi:hypothetical protein